MGPPSNFFFQLVKKVKKLAPPSINQSLKSQKQCVHSRILLAWQKVCVKRHQHQFTVVLNNWKFRRNHWHEFYIKILVWRHTKFNWFRSWIHPEHFLFAKWACERLTEIADFGKKNHLFRWSSLWFWRVCKEAKLSHLHRNPQAYIEKPTHPKRVRILVQRHNWAIFLRK